MSAAIANVVSDHDLQREASHWKSLAQSLTIADRGDYEIAAGHLLNLKALLGEADKIFDPIIRKAHEAHREATMQKKRIIEPLQCAEVVIKLSMTEFTTEERRKRDAEEQSLREQAERDAAEKREREIEAAESSLDASPEEIQAIIQAPLDTAPVGRMPMPPTRVLGITERTTWKAEVTDFSALIKFVANNPRFENLLRPDPVAISTLARSLRTATHIPGVRVWSEQGIAVTGRNSR